MEPNETRNAWLIPIAILIAGVILAVTLFLVRASDALAPSKGDPSQMRPVSVNEHVFGNPDAKIVFVTYADIDSSHTKDFQQAMEQLLVEYGPEGKVAWVYRHFPIFDENDYSAQHAEAAECVAELSGNTAFLRFIDAIQAAAPDSAEFDPSAYPVIAEQLGIDTTELMSCIESHRFQGKVADDLENAIRAGGTGSPYTIVLIEGKKPRSINGSVPYQTLKQAVEAAYN